MNLLDSFRVMMSLFDAHMRRDAHRASKHLGSKRRRASKALCRDRRKRQRQARRINRLFSK